MKKDIKLYNMIFPPFLILAFTPWYWGASIIGNFIIDSIVLFLIILIVFKKLDFKFYVRKVFLVYAFGFAADFIGIIYLFIGSEICSELCNFGKIQQGTFARNLLEGMAGIMHFSRTDIYTYIALGSGILLASIVIFIFNYFVVFRKKDMTRKQRLFAALMLAILTAPYTFLLRSFAITG